MTYIIRFTPEATQQLVELEQYIMTAATAHIAAQYVQAIVTYCEGLAVFPHRGTARDDLRPGLRTSSYKKRVIVAFSVDDTVKTITIAGIFYGGQDITRIFADE